MNDNIYNTKHDAEVEEAEALEREKHIGGLCEGPPKCSFCLDDIAEQEWEDREQAAAERKDYEKV